jgi:hypothetical protein
MRNWLKENWFRVGILVSILIVAYSVYQVLVVRPDIERQEAATAKFQADLAEIEQKSQQAIQKEQTKKELDSCLTDASTSYSNQWYRECKGSGLLNNKCIDLHDLGYQQYLDKYALTEEKYKQQRGITSTSTLAGLFDYIGRYNDECSCRLPLSLADRLDGQLKDDKNLCYKLNPQN